MSTQEQRQEWRELAAAATPGEWYAERVPFKDTDAACIDNRERRIVTLYPPLENRHADAAFIAAAREAVPALLADVDALTAQNERITEQAMSLLAARDALAAELDAIPYEQLYRCWHNDDGGYILEDANAVAAWLAEWKLSQPQPQA